MEIFRSATKIVLLTLTLGFIIMAFMGKIDSNNYMVAFIMVLQFYFQKKENK